MVNLVPNYKVTKLLVTKLGITEDEAKLLLGGN
jgi:hypothetical protein